ncbi:unnamed protein product [Caenorhabditis brenneri]
MRFIFFFLLPVIVMAKSNNTLCFMNFVYLKNISKDLTLLYMTAGCNILLLVLNITILYTVLGFMKPTISEIRKQTFIIMDNILLSYIPSPIRDILSCRSEVKLGEEGNQSTGKGGKTSKGTTKTGTSKTSTGTTKTGTTAAASE